MFTLRLSEVGNAANLWTSPSMVTAKQWLSPQAICFICTPCNALIGWGINKSLEFPWPNLPKSPLQKFQTKQTLYITQIQAYSYEGKEQTGFELCTKLKQLGVCHHVNRLLPGLSISLTKLTACRIMKEYRQSNQEIYIYRGIMIILFVTVNMNINVATMTKCKMLLSQIFKVAMYSIL